ncbi:MAG: hypothetical protein ACK5D5_09280 [Bacteroidota bacterium]
MEQIIIIPLKGIEGLFFGSSVEQTIIMFGDPDEKENIKDEITEAESLVFHYWKKGFSLFFNQEVNMKLTCFEVDAKETLLFGERIFEMNENEIIELFKKNGFLLSETENHEWGEKRLSFDDALMDLYFENGSLVSVNFGHLPGSKNFYFLPN